MLEKIWKNLEFIYLSREWKDCDAFHFDDHIGWYVRSTDNYYYMSFATCNSKTKIKIEKNYHLSNMWSNNKTGQNCSYKLYVEVVGKSNLDEPTSIRIANGVIDPILREIKLNKII